MRLREAAAPAVAGGSTLALVVVAVHGVSAGRFLALLSASARCPGGPLADPAVVESAVPLSSRCMWADGTSTELVPTWVNPAIAVLLLLLLVSLVLHARTVYRRFDGGRGLLRSPWWRLT